MLFSAATTTLRVTWKILPERLRWLPEALHAIRDARRHPEKYQQPEAMPA